MSETQSIADHFAEQLRKNDIELKRPTGWQKADEDSRRLRAHQDPDAMRRDTKPVKAAFDGVEGIF